MYVGDPDYDLMLGAHHAPETGFLDTVVDFAAGGPQKRRRERAATKEAAQAREQIAKLEAERQGIIAQAHGTTTAMAPTPAAPPSFLQRAVAIARQPTPIFGLPVWGVALGAVLAWKVLR
jgi:hypothetical protein